MKATNTRQNSRKATPLGVIAAMPKDLNATGITNREWEKAKAAFEAANERLEAAANAHDAMEHEQSAIAAAAPKRSVAFVEDGLQIDRPGLNVNIPPQQRTATLTRANHQKFGPLLKDHPEYASFCEELAQWEPTYQAAAVAGNWAGVEQEWQEALDAHWLAWKALMACPVATAPHVAEKLAHARPGYFDEESANLVVEAVTADIAQLVNGRA